MSPDLSAGYLEWDIRRVEVLARARVHPLRRFFSSLVARVQTTDTAVCLQSNNTSPSPNTPLAQSALSGFPPRWGAALPSRDLTAPGSWPWEKLKPVREVEPGLFNAFSAASTRAGVLRRGAVAWSCRSCAEAGLEVQHFAAAALQLRRVSQQQLIQGCATNPNI